MPRSLRRIHTFADVRLAAQDEIYFALSHSGFNLPGPVNVNTMNNVIEAQAPPAPPNNPPMHFLMEIDTETFVVGAVVPAVAPPAKDEKKLRKHGALPYNRPFVLAMRNKDLKKKTRRVSFKVKLDTIGEENEFPAPPAPVKRGGSFTEMFKNMHLSR